jgi:DNA-binding PadR family transcriptional regulator
LAEHDHAPQRAFLLLQLAIHGRLTKGEFNKRLTQTVRKQADLNKGTADQLLADLVRDGYAREDRPTKRAVVYTITEKGSDWLFTSNQPIAVPVSLTGAQFNEIKEKIGEHVCTEKGVAVPVSVWSGLVKKLERVQSEIAGSREMMQTATQMIQTATQRADQATKDWRQILEELHSVAQSKPTSPPAPNPVPANLADEILQTFQELLRERYGHSGLVPIHDVRRHIAKEYGPEAARHDAFDEQVKQLSRQKRVRLLSISDLRDATREQLEDSIPGVNETLFYLEAAHEHAHAT